MGNPLHPDVRFDPGATQPGFGDLLGALRYAAPRLLGYVVVLAFAWLTVVVVVVAAPLIIFVMSDSAGLTIGVAIVTAIAAIGLLILTAARWSVAIPVLMLEGLGPLDALRRSWRLVAGRTWRTLGIIFIASLVVGVVGGFISPIYIPGVAEGILSGSPSSYLLVAIVSAVVQVFVGPIFPLLLTVLYLDYAAARPTA